MAEDHIRYDILTQDALRGVVKKVLTEVEKTGLPGEHHFFISFATLAPGVRISERLLEKYPNEMTIVLQNQFWNLQVSDSGFEVGLSFDGINETLVIPFAALKGFFDPSVQFGLQFDVGGEIATVDNTDQDGDMSDADIAELQPKAAPTHAEDNAEEGKDGDEDGDDASAEKVVSLDAFRKKP